MEVIAILSAIETVVNLSSELNRKITVIAKAQNEGRDITEDEWNNLDSELTEATSDLEESIKNRINS